VWGERMELELLGTSPVAKDIAEWHIPRQRDGARDAPRTEPRVSKQPCPNRQHPVPSLHLHAVNWSTPNDELSTPRDGFRMASSFEFEFTLKHGQPHGPQRPPRRRRLPFSLPVSLTRAAVKRSRPALDKDRIAKTRCRSVQDTSSPRNPLH
jgi:hypothetical protein